MTIVVHHRWNQWSTYDNDRRFLPPQQRLTEFTRCREHMPRDYALNHNRLGQLYFQPIVRK